MTTPRRRNFACRGALALLLASLAPRGSADGGVDAARGMAGPMLLGLVPMSARRGGDLELQGLAAMSLSSGESSGILAKNSGLMGESIGGALHWRFSDRLGLAALVSGAAGEGREPVDASLPQSSGRHRSYGLLAAAGVSAEAIGRENLRLPFFLGLSYLNFWATRGLTHLSHATTDGQRSLGAALGPSLQVRVGPIFLTPFALGTTAFQGSDLGRSPAGKLIATAGLECAVPSVPGGLNYSYTQGLHAIGARWAWD